MLLLFPDMRCITCGKNLDWYDFKNGNPEHLVIHIQHDIERNPEYAARIITELFYIPNMPV
jgi:hypothetical protein